MKRVALDAEDLFDTTVLFYINLFFEVLFSYLIITQINK